MAQTTKISLAQLKQNLHRPPSNPATEAELEFSAPPPESAPEVDLEQLQAQAQQGYAPAQYQLGLFYANSVTGHLDYSQAATWIGLAAEQGYAPAQSVLGWLYSTGYGLRADDTKAGYWYLQAAQQGSSKDQYMVATMYRWGRYGVAKDPRQMLLWYERAARTQFGPAQHALGKLLQEGKLVQQDLEGALHWLSLAVLNRNQPAQTALNQLMTQMPPELLARAQQSLLSALAAGQIPARNQE